MATFRTSSVFRFTHDFELLRKILRDGIIPNYCEERFSFEGEKEICRGIPMACFCDIPITLLDEHNRRYGNYGIALSKEWAISRGVTPIMYITNVGILRSVLDNAFSCQITGYLKTYSGLYIGKPVNNYEENEWRYVVPDSTEIRWFRSENEYKKWRFPNNDMRVKKPNPTDQLKQYTLRFTGEDISYIMVKDKDFKERIIKYIKKLRTIGGNPIDKSEVTDDLISKIVTLDQIKEDF